MGRLTYRNKYGEATVAIDFRKVMERLAYYEDLEEQVLKSTGTDLASMVGEFMHYYNLKKENRLLELPCKVGGTVYVPIAYFSPLEFVKKTEIIKSRFGFSMINDIGKTVFLTKAEAEKALAEMEKENEID